MTVKLLTEHHLECLSLKGDCRGSSESKYHIVGNLLHWLNYRMDHSLNVYAQLYSGLHV